MAAKSERLEPNGRKRVSEGCITHEDRVIREALHRRTILKGTE